MNDLTPVGTDYRGFQSEIVALLNAARRTAARSVNALMSATYWEIGRRIVEFEQGGRQRAAYGQALLKHLSKDLTAVFGRGFSERNLEQMRLFYLERPCAHISQTPSAKCKPSRISSSTSATSALIQGSEAACPPPTDLTALTQAFPLPWSAYVRLLSVKSPDARAFYETEALQGGWSVRQLDRQINIAAHS